MNNAHIDIETLSAYLDGQATVGERARVTNHLTSCTRCAADLARLQEASRSLARLGRTEMTVDEHRALRQGLLDRVARRPVRRWQPGRLQWSLAGAFALVAVAIAGFSMMRLPQKGNDSLTEAAAPAQDVAGAIVIDSDDQISSRVLALPEVKALGGERDRAAALKSESLEQANAPARSGQPEPLSVPAAPPNPQPAAGGAGGGTGGDGGGSGAFAGTQGFGNADSAAGKDFSFAAGSSCSEAVAAGQGEPLTPVTIREATYKSMPVWLAVFSKPDGRLVAIVVDPQGCGGTSAPHILSRSEFPAG